MKMSPEDFTSLLNMFRKKNCALADLRAAAARFPAAREVLAVEPALRLLFNKWEKTPYDVKASELKKLNLYVKNKFYNILSLYYIFKTRPAAYIEGGRYLPRISGATANPKYKIDTGQKTIDFAVTNLSDAYELFLEIARAQMKRMLYIVANRNGIKAKIRLHVIKRGHRCFGYCCSEYPVRIGFKWQMIFIPEPLQEVLICHELAHLKHMNHGENFWACHEKLLGGPVFEADKQMSAAMSNFVWLCNP